MDSVDSAAPSPQHGLRVVGVLGGVGSGKSTAARFLAQALAAPHLDAEPASQLRKPQYHVPHAAPNP